MKLNLLPTYVSKERSAKAAWVFSFLIAAVSIVASVFMFQKSSSDLETAKNEALDVKPRAEEAVRISKEADTIMAQARGIIVNIDLANAMMQHNAKYADLYDEIRPFVPSFFRVSAMSANPVGADTCVVTLQGVIRTHQQYADLMLALLRIPGASSVTRDGYQITDPLVPSLIEEDQTGRPVKPGEANIPDDPMRRLDYFLAQGEPPGFRGVGGFGTDEIGPKGAMPDWSVITVSIVVPRNIQTPDPRATLSGMGGAPAAPAGGAPGGFAQPRPSGTGATAPTPGRAAPGGAGEDER